MEYVITLENVGKKFGNFTAVENLNLKVKKGEIFGLLGPNGAGKSTTIRMIIGVLAPTEGHGNVLGYDIFSEGEEIKNHIGYMSQKFSLYEDLTVYENIKFYSEIYSIKKSIMDERIEQIIEMAGLEGRVNQITKHLSGGWKQRLALGCALIHKPNILILDEPTAGVDPVSRRLFWESLYSLSKQNITILVTTHYMDEAESCDRVGFVFGGKILAEGRPEELIKSYNSSNLEDVFIKFVEEQTGETVQNSFDKLKFIYQEDK
jgi:ABC-2 type transport system ATP-binding protein